MRKINPKFIKMIVSPKVSQLHLFVASPTIKQMILHNSSVGIVHFNTVKYLGKIGCMAGNCTLLDSHLCTTNNL